jgi:hypothetical protein
MSNVQTLPPVNQVEVIKSQSAAIVTPMEMLAQAVEKGMPVETIDKLLALSERWDKTQSRKAFDEAIAAAKAEIPPIIKNREVDFTGKTGIRTHYRHEDLAEIARTVDPILGRHGLSYRFRATSNINEPVAVTCILSHRLGHFEETTLTAGRDDSGNKNSIQAVGSTITFLQRYTLKVALGLAASNDDDGNGASAGYDAITEDQAIAIRELIEATGADEAAFKKWLKVESIAAIPATKFKDAMTALEAKRGRNANR